MKLLIRRAQEEDGNIFTYFTTELVKFNQINHNNNCLHGDDSDLVMNAIQRKSKETFKNNAESLILIAESDNQPVGYVLGRIYKEAEMADQGYILRSCLRSLSRTRPVFMIT